MRNPKTFSVIIISLIWRLSTRNYHMRNKIIDKTTKNNKKKAVKNEIVTNTVTRLMTVFSGDQMSVIAVTIVQSFFMISF